jgi:hypoxanthine-guanine phosphoribosyltransferase
MPLAKTPEMSREDNYPSLHQPIYEHVREAFGINLAPEDIEALEQQRAHHFSRLNENGMEYAILGESEVQLLSNRIARHIATDERLKQLEEGEDYVPPAFISLMNGGSMFTSLLGAELNRYGFTGFDPVQIHITRYENEQAGGKVPAPKVGIHRDDAPKIAGRRVYVIDDLIDEGETLNYTLDYLTRRLKRLGLEPPADFKTVVLGYKGITEEPDYYGALIPVEWIVGCGCDSQGHCRFCDIVGVAKYQGEDLTEKKERRVQQDRVRHERNRRVAQKAIAFSEVRAERRRVEKMSIAERRQYFIDKAA